MSSSLGLSLTYIVVVGTAFFVLFAIAIGLVAHRVGLHQQQQKRVWQDRLAEVRDQPLGSWDIHHF